MNQEKIYSVMVGETPLVFKTGKIAKQADGAVLASHGETVILSTACMTETPRTGIDFFPLTVDYEERYYAAGKIPGGFVKREGKPADSGILGSRVAYRSIRSLFPDDMHNDVHVVNTVMAVDQIYPPQILGINGASAALAISGIPWGGPVGAVRIGLIGGKLIVNPTEAQMENSMLNLIVAGHEDGITMVESGSYEVSEELLVDALELAHSEIKKIIDFAPAGIIVPMVMNAEEAKRAIEAMRYPPTGNRGCGFRRGLAYGAGDFDEYWKASAHDPIVILQLEHVDAYRDLDRILALDGLDSIMIGPYDFSASMGKAGQWDAPELRAIFDDACRRIRAAGVMLGVALDVRAEEWRARGAQWMAVKGDMTALVERWREVIRSLKR
ncbi:MAG: hypothetical protein IJP67_06065 [Oscillospiraceae bacterium]|nr:hypothetical protein [Oscillospiraceae bacterium]